MRMFDMRPFGPSVDLDDPETYSHLPQTSKELDAKMFQEIGYALVYMDLYYPDLFPAKRKYVNHPYTGKRILDCGYEQRQRINKLIEEFAKNRKDHYNDIIWLREQVFMFQNETENMC